MNNRVQQMAFKACATEQHPIVNNNRGAFDTSDHADKAVLPAKLTRTFARKPLIVACSEFTTDNYPATGQIVKTWSFTGVPTRENESIAP